MNRMTESEKVKLEAFFDVRQMNAWMHSAKGKPVPKQLFGDLWREGEVAIMFADTGKGKSVLAVQMAESIARGRQVAPFAINAKPQKVLYLDFELTEKQIEMRYSAEHDPAQAGVLKRQYDFSKKFYRVELKPDVLAERDGNRLEEALRDQIQPLIIKSGAKILIIDNITYLKRTADSMRDAIPLMKELQRLKKRFGLSILVIAHTPKRDASRPLTVNDLQGSKVIANYADNIFAIGQSRRDPLERYIKHIKPRSSEAETDEHSVPFFRFTRIGGNFLGFVYAGRTSETELLRAAPGTLYKDVHRQVWEMHDKGVSIRAIAEKANISKSTVHRYLQVPRPVQQPSSPIWELAYEDDEFPDLCVFPGNKSYLDAMKKVGEFAGDGEREIDSAIKSHEYRCIEAACERAMAVFDETGNTPNIYQDDEYMKLNEAIEAFYDSGGEVVKKAIRAVVAPFLGLSESTAAAGGDLSEPSAIAGGCTQQPDIDSNNGLTDNEQPTATAVGSDKIYPFLYDGSSEAEEWFQYLIKRYPTMEQGSLLSHYAAGNEWCRPPWAIPPYDPENPFSKMEHEKDGSGKDIYIEERDERGKKKIWYKYGPTGILTRYVLTGIGYMPEKANPNLFGKFAQIDLPKKKVPW